MERNVEELIKKYNTLFHDKLMDEEQEYAEILYVSDIDQLFKLSGSRQQTAEDRLFTMCGNAWKAGVITGYQCACADLDQAIEKLKNVIK